MSGPTAEYQRKRTALAVAFLDSLKTQSCVDCGEQFPSYCKDFDHREPKASRDRALARMAGAGMSLSKIEEEARKCDVVCANCHRVRTQCRRIH